MYFSQRLCNFFCVKSWWRRTAFFLFFFFPLQTTPLTSEHSKSKSDPIPTLGKAPCYPEFDSDHASYSFYHIFQNDKATANDKEMLPLMVPHVPWEQAAMPCLKKQSKTKKTQPPSNTFLNTPRHLGFCLHKMTWGSCFCNGPWQETKGAGGQAHLWADCTSTWWPYRCLLNTDSKGFNFFLPKAICQIQK